MRSPLIRRKIEKLIVIATNPSTNKPMQKQLTNQFTIETEQEEDGRWIAEILEIPGALVYSNSQQQAIFKVQALALRILADKLENGEIVSVLDSFSFVAA